jgi:hypothetical protein
MRATLLLQNVPSLLGGNKDFCCVKVQLCRKVEMYTERSQNLVILILNVIMS